MRLLEDCCGVWVGIWHQFDHRGHMRMNLNFSQGTIEGKGSDDTGAFVAVGSYEATDFVELIKGYSTHMFRYEGQWDGTMIYGKSFQVGLPSNRGTFEMWPEGEDLTVEQMNEELQDVVLGEAVIG
jgi:hypothetical protein